MLTLSPNTTDFTLAAPLADTPPRRPGVLIADDELPVRTVVAAHLEREGFAVWTAADGLEALSTFFDHTGEVDVLLLDVSLPDIPGPAAYRRLRAHYPGVACCFMTADPYQPDAEEARALGARVLVKPFSLAVLTRVIGHLAQAEAEA
jgi:CheY-like chemotaxis protein